MDLQTICVRLCCPLGKRRGQDTVLSKEKREIAQTISMAFPDTNGDFFLTIDGI